MSEMRRDAWTALTDAQLLAQCEVDTYRASGPGGQKRNKTSSAVRLRHPPSGLIVIAEESRSQHENRAARPAPAAPGVVFETAGGAAAGGSHPGGVGGAAGLRAGRDADGRLHPGRKDPRYWPAVGVVLDVLQAVEVRVGEAAEALGVSTGNLIDFLSGDDKVWEQANHMARPLRAQGPAFLMVGDSLRESPANRGAIGPLCRRLK